MRQAVLHFCLRIAPAQTVPKNSISKKNCRCTTLAHVTMRAFRRLGVLAKDVCRLDGQCVENGSFDSNLISYGKSSGGNFSCGLDPN
jgi:hypothetical protein